MNAKYLNFIKTKTKDVALSSFCTYDNNVPQHLSKRELVTLKLKKKQKQKQIAIQKSEKGNFIVTVNKDK